MDDTNGAGIGLLKRTVRIRITPPYMYEEDEMREEEDGQTSKHGDTEKISAEDNKDDGDD